MMIFEKKKNFLEILTWKFFPISYKNKKIAPRASNLYGKKRRRKKNEANLLHDDINQKWNSVYWNVWEAVCIIFPKARI